MNNRLESRFNMFNPADYVWSVRKIPNHLGEWDFMIEVIGADGCVSFGESMTAAKKGLAEALQLWIRIHGELSLPETCAGAQIILLEPPMDKEEMEYIHTELQKLK